jgi:hypothetical protein
MRVALGREHPLEPHGRRQDWRLREVSGHEHSIGNRGLDLKRAGPPLEVRLASTPAGVPPL